MVVGATNRPHVLDCVLTRPGRLDTMLVVDLSDCHTRKEIFSRILKSVPNNTLVQYRMPRDYEGYTGADMECAVRESVLLQLVKNMSAMSLEQDSLDTANWTQNETDLIVYLF